MIKTLIIVIGLFASLAAMSMDRATANVVHLQQQKDQKTLTRQLPIKVTIQTAQDTLGSLSDHFKVGDRIVVPITMTNTSASALSVCISSDLYQDQPTLTKQRATVSVMSWQSEMVREARRDDTCNDVNLPETIDLNPNEPKVVDWLVLVDSKVSTGAEAWYDSLPPGKYELSINRRFECCSGPRVESNKVGFEVLP
jgi:hypothetical protein